MKKKLNEEEKALKRKNYYDNYEHYKKYREERKAKKAEYDRKRCELKSDKIKKVNKEYYNRIKSTPKYKERIKEYEKSNKERRNELARISSKKHRDKIAAKTAKKRAYKNNATPNWITKEQLEEITEFYTLAKELSWLFEGAKLHVDHIIPLKGESVCGLHVPWNLQLLPAKDNLKKSNKLIACRVNTDL